ncbi:hypothetical protein A1Q1_02042 [Trichosporon asahii var. asahii CBS 2479]|uniref:DOMON domain-containing protein n=1 Tax=Trichosporon asahii var. asahii (strain ATCC 90039 / CBS 2479 / JCM 2466 / KCTC 7840 / NBRC 103889/ NCYC 2677 / UAMH 7654) TaxID=1186058 RepID=J5QSI0_TRIAS|nr:hypothetical protein A1Q1_02042 [Trichosporon asahii var. asahii CBS 2479]EJT48873.1 hypothetical protein A1Q1_02042 [Trichosporon asahii var. asahii CBS 2479]
MHFFPLLLCAFASLGAALKILHPAQDETVRADFKYEIQWATNASDPEWAYFALLSDESGDTNGRWRLRTAAHNHSFLPSFADLYNPEARNGARVRLEVRGRVADSEGVIDSRVLDSTEFWVNGTSWANNLMPDFNWSKPPRPSSTPRSAEEQARILNAAGAARAHVGAGALVGIVAAAALL